MRERFGTVLALVIFAVLPTNQRRPAIEPGQTRAERRAAVVDRDQAVELAGDGPATTGES